MTTLCTFAGKYGDLLWALPTVRAIARKAGEPVDLVIAWQFKSITPLLSAQPYIRRCTAVEWWQTQDTAPISPRTPPRREGDYDRVVGIHDRIVHLGYREWPLPDVARHTYLTARLAGEEIREADLALDEPWITESIYPHGIIPMPLVVGFTDEYFELKYGIVRLLEEPAMVVGGNPRWVDEGGIEAMGWSETVTYLREARAFLGCCSALHVLAVACGVPVVLMEPNPQRHNDVFYPLGKTGRVQLVTGADGLPTFDARHVRDAVEAAMEVVR